MDTTLVQSGRMPQSSHIDVIVSSLPLVSSAENLPIRYRKVVTMVSGKGAFGPETVPLLIAAFDKAWERFLRSADRRLDGRSKVRSDLAACLIDRFKAGETDPSQLAREALAELRRRELGHN